MPINVDEKDFNKMKEEEPPCITCKKNIRSIEEAAAHSNQNRPYITGLMQHTCRSCEYGLPVTFNIPGVRENTSKELTEAFISARKDLMSKYNLPISILREIFPIINDDSHVYAGSRVTIKDFANCGINLPQLNPCQIKRMMPETLKIYAIRNISIVTNNNSSIQESGIIYTNHGRNIIRVEYPNYY